MGKNKDKKEQETILKMPYEREVELFSIRTGTTGGGGTKIICLRKEYLNEDVAEGAGEYIYWATMLRIEGWCDGLLLGSSTHFIDAPDEDLRAAPKRIQELIDKLTLVKVGLIKEDH